MDIRDARAADVPAIVEIYNQAIREGDAVWRDEEVDVADRSAWLRDHQDRGQPVIVAEDDGEILGYACYSSFRGFSGYDLTVENSVYLSPAAQGRGLGTTLMEELIDRARAAGMHVMVAGVTATNEASLRLHARLGFTEVARMPEVGRKFGNWLTLVYLQRILD
ncbi:acetyltransferase [Corynebacterium frankenforstense DSM 45800]|uniref:Acetyltransferase n=1 Tax=Corynebacterium frankenforstense DSM 45800 TaxID=1437875 RepID=A0A1L7CRR8_9CORY|nr:GNAT family N-acetyltransferase [Corynebacterium frankenforstense]APT88527.1 acetyltransferase [Corynebacterium frankenforstense DSM 45800]